MKPAADLHALALILLAAVALIGAIVLIALRIPVPPALWAVAGAALPTGLGLTALNGPQTGQPAAPKVIPSTTVDPAPAAPAGPVDVPALFPPPAAVTPLPGDPGQVTP